MFIKSCPQIVALFSQVYHCSATTCEIITRLKTSRDANNNARGFHHLIQIMRDTNQRQARRNSGPWRNAVKEFEIRLIV